MSHHDNFRYLNRDGLWPNFDSEGLELRPDGAWQLATVPRNRGPLPDGLDNLPIPGSPAGITVGPDGSLYYTQPARHLIMRIDGCDERRQPMPCLDGHGDRPTQLSYPRGLAYHEERQAIVVADGGNHRLQFFNVGTFQLRDIWQGFYEPLALATDADGNLYVVDEDGRRVRKFDLLGNERPGFWARLQDGEKLGRVTAVAVVDLDQGRHIILLDSGNRSLILLDEKGNRRYAQELKGIEQPLGLAVFNKAVYVGDNERRRLFKLKWQENGGNLEFVGAARGYQGPVSALAIGPEESLWLLPGGEYAPLALATGAAYVGSGWLYSGPITPEEYPVHWQQIKAFADLPDGDAHIQLFTYTNDDEPPVPPNGAPPPHSTGEQWQALPVDVADAWVPGEAPEDDADEYFVPARHLWVGVLFSSGGKASPILHQLRVSYDQSTLRHYLPPIFGHDPVQRELLDRMLSLFQSFYGDVEMEIAMLSRLFDPESAPAEWLPWLAGWLDLQLDETWPEKKQRKEIAMALREYARRGTLSGLKEVLSRHAGVDARIEEPLVQAGWWMLADSEKSSPLATQNACLGFTTMLAAAEADGAVVGTTATLDHSHLTAAEDWGAPLFTELAYRFTVQLYRSQAEKAGLDRIRAVLDREKPAHTAYHLCLIEPKMRIGFQARLGIDAIVAGPVPATRLNQPSSHGEHPVLGGEQPGRMDGHSRIGRSTRLAG